MVGEAIGARRIIRTSLADHRMNPEADFMDWQVSREGWMQIGSDRVRAALGRSGVISESDKKEGDGATPLGVYAIRRVLWRGDRVERPATAFPVRPIRADDGWCDAPEDPGYNRPVRLPYAASAETLSRDDELYDIIVVLAHNDDPPQPGLGSAIFLHCKRGDYEPTEGCVALAPADVRRFLNEARPGDRIEIR